MRSNSTGRGAKDGSSRDRIRSAAAAVFAERGYQAATVREICGRARANVALIRYFFGSKKALYLEVCRWLFVEQAPQFDIPMAGRAALRRWVGDMARRVTDDRPPHYWAVRIFAQERTRPTEVTPLIHRRFWQPNFKALMAIIAAAQPAGASPRSLRMRTVALFAQLTTFAYRDPPWDRVLGLPARSRRAAWVREWTDFLVTQIAGPDPAQGKT
jgi:AcrR family transcriptional regulator